MCTILMITFRFDSRSVRGDSLAGNFLDWHCDTVYRCSYPTICKHTVNIALCNIINNALLFQIIFLKYMTLLLIITYLLLLTYY